jgi:hypothetical protein
MKTIPFVMLALALALGGCREAKPAALEIVKAELSTRQTFGTDGEFRGSIHNPRKTPARGVVVSCEVFMLDLLAKSEEGKKPKPLTTMDAWIDYLPAGATVEFETGTWLGQLPKYASVRRGKVEITEGNKSGK